MGKPKAMPATKGAGKGKAAATQQGSNTTSYPATVGRTRLLLQGRVVLPGQNRQAAPKLQSRPEGSPRGSRHKANQWEIMLHSSAADSAADCSAGCIPSICTPCCAREPRHEEVAGWEASPASADVAHGARHKSTEGMTSGPVLPEGLERVGEVTEERGTSRDEAATAGGAGESDVVVTEPAAAALPRVVAAAVPEAAAAAVPAAETVAGPVRACGSAAAFGGGSSSPSATPHVAQLQAEETRLCAHPEQTREVA
ncbi:unnamed protein product [Closterium sp. NIES-65]|nr:unnamed protein product [Closterium sp. NIES-65]